MRHYLQSVAGIGVFITMNIQVKVVCMQDEPMSHTAHILSDCSVLIFSSIWRGTIQTKWEHWWSPPTTTKLLSLSTSSQHVAKCYRVSHSNQLIKLLHYISRAGSWSEKLNWYLDNDKFRKMWLVLESYSRFVTVICGHCGELRTTVASTEDANHPPYACQRRRGPGLLPGLRARREKCPWLRQLFFSLFRLQNFSRSGHRCRMRAVKSFCSIPSRPVTHDGHHSSDQSHKDIP